MSLDVKDEPRREATLALAAFSSWCRWTEIDPSKCRAVRAGIETHMKGAVRGNYVLQLKGAGARRYLFLLFR